MIESGLGKGRSALRRSRRPRRVRETNQRVPRRPNGLGRGGVGETRQLARQTGIADNLPLVETCNRAGTNEAKVMFATKRTHYLGLSAMPDRTDDPGHKAEEDELSTPKGSLFADLHSLRYSYTARVIQSGVNLKGCRRRHYTARSR